MGTRTARLWRVACRARWRQRHAVTKHGPTVRSAESSWNITVVLASAILKESRKQKRTHGEARRGCRTPAARGAPTHMVAAMEPLVRSRSPSTPLSRTLQARQQRCSARCVAGVAARVGKRGPGPAVGHERGHAAASCLAGPERRAAVRDQRGTKRQPGGTEAVLDTNQRKRWPGDATRRKKSSKHHAQRRQTCPRRTGHRASC
ncbi:hypothetical protein ERJ75_001118700 [Trypanosoma vivax]|nr:hypothetical protein ERJ75_001118700 [Trypanosoma vivax]